MKPHNYSAKMLDETSAVFSPMQNEDTGEIILDVVKDKNTGRMADKTYQAIRDGIACASKYMLPDDGIIEGFDLKNKKQYVDMVRMPYSAVALELKMGGIPTILLCQAHSDLGIGKFAAKDKSLRNTLRDRQGNYIPMIDALDIVSEHIGVGFSVLPIQLMPDGGLRRANRSIRKHINYNPSPAWVIFQFVGNMAYSDIATWSSVTDLELPFSIESLDEDQISVDVIRDKEDNFNKEIHTFFGMIMEIVTQFCVFSNMKGIEAKKISVPSKVNRKRINRGKKPLFEYKILDVHERVIRGNVMGDTGGHKNRWHTVCGHPRFYKNKDKPVWIKPHSRGDKQLGVIDKAYKINK